MRHLEGVGVEYGTAWVINHLLSEEVEAVNIDEAFEDSVRGCYEDEVKLAWVTVDPLHILKELYPCDWDMAKNDWIDMEVEDELMIEMDGKYYRTYDIEAFIEKELEVNVA